ncbi:MAG: aminopeptidase N, partial [Nitratireductor sp.]
MLRTDTAKPTKTPTIKLKDYKPFDFDIENVDLDFQLHPSETIVTSTIAFKRRKGVAAKAPLLLDGDGLELVSIKLNGETLPKVHYKETAQSLRISNLPA